MRSGRRLRGRRGATLVEFALLSSFLFVILFGIIEFSVLLSHQLTLINATREATRQGSAGKSATRMRETVRIRSQLNVLDSQIEIETNGARDGSGTWTAVTDDVTGLANTGVEGYPIRVRIVRWPHMLVTGSFFSWLVRGSAGGIPLSASQSLRRE